MESPLKPGWMCNIVTVCHSSTQFYTKKISSARGDERHSSNTFQPLTPTPLCSEYSCLSLSLSLVLHYIDSVYSSTSTIVLECARALCVYSVVIVQECYSGAYAICAILTAGPLVYYSVVVTSRVYIP